MFRLTSLVLLGALSAAPASAATWNLDGAHSRVSFRVAHMTVGTVDGQFTGVKGTLDYELGEPGSMKVDVTIDTSTVDTRNADRDAHLKSPEFLDVAAFPNMTFVSRSVRAGRQGSFTITGDLTLHGVTKQVELRGQGLERSAVDPWGNTRVGASASTTINRQDYGVSWNKTLDQGGVLVGDMLDIRLDLEFTKAER